MLKVEALLDPEAFPHAVSQVRLLETHISWVILTGDVAYKLKKPVSLGFIDYSTLERRHHFCHEEVRLNRRLAPELYLGVIAVRGSEEHPRLGGRGPVLDYAVKMREFPQRRLLDHQIATGELRPAQIDEIAETVARFHGRIERASARSALGTPDRVHAPMRDNFDYFRHHAVPGLDSLEHWSEEAFQRLRKRLQQRHDKGFVRECHGDMHLGNMARMDGHVVIFDGIEFNDDFKWIDTVSELAFLTVDLAHRGRPDFGWRFLNRYLEWTGDYAGMDLLCYYQVYRLMVRAKVAHIRLCQPSVDPTEQARLEGELDSLLGQALDTIRPRRGALVLTRGPSGSGKSFITAGLLEQLGAFRLRSDVERKRLFWLAPEEPSDSGLQTGIYTAEASRRTFERLRGLARDLLAQGYPVFLDATFLEASARQPFQAMAAELAVPFAVLDIVTPEELLRQRVARRAEQGADASEADLEVLRAQLRDYRPLDEPGILSVDGACPPAPEALLERLRNCLGT